MSKMYDASQVAAHRSADPMRALPGFWRRAVALLTGLSREMKAHRAARGLAAFDERGLADIGLSPGGIHHAVRNGRQRPGSCSRMAATGPGARPLPASAFTEWR